LARHKKEPRAFNARGSERRHRAAVALAIEPLARASKIVRGLRKA
jgi:hypothetical protein